MDDIVLLLGTSSSQSQAKLNRRASPHKEGPVSSQFIGDQDLCHQVVTLFIGRYVTSHACFALGGTGRNILLKSQRSPTRDMANGANAIESPNTTGNTTPINLKAGLGVPL